jgi:excisionase family DNA binding protein
MADPKVLSIEDAAKVIGVSKATLKRLIDSGNMPSVLIGPRRRVVLITDIDAYLQAHRTIKDR